MSFPDPEAVQRIVEKVSALSDESIVVDQGIYRAKRDAAKYVEEHAANFIIVSKVTPPIDALYEIITTLLSKARSIAGIKIVGHLDDFLEVQIVIVEEIETDQDRKDAIRGLESFLAEEDPSKGNLEGLNGVADIFGCIWKVIAEQAEHILLILEKINPDNLEKAIEQLKQQLVPVKDGVGKIRKAVHEYARKID